MTFKQRHLLYLVFTCSLIGCEEQKPAANVTTPSLTYRPQAPPVSHPEGIPTATTAQPSFTIPEAAKKASDKYLLDTRFGPYLIVTSLMKLNDAQIASIKDDPMYQAKFAGKRPLMLVVMVQNNGTSGELIPTLALMKENNPDGAVLPNYELPFADHYNPRESIQPGEHRGFKFLFDLDTAEGVSFIDAVREKTAHLSFPQPLIVTPDVEMKR